MASDSIRASTRAETEEDLFLLLGAVKELVLKLGLHHGSKLQNFLRIHNTCSTTFFTTNLRKWVCFRKTDAQDLCQSYWQCYWTARQWLLRSRLKCWLKCCFHAAHSVFSQCRTVQPLQAKHKLYLRMGPPVPPSLSPTPIRHRDLTNSGKFDSQDNLLENFQFWKFFLIIQHKANSTPI